jgi:hypothetical protein
MQNSILIDQHIADNIEGATPGLPREAILDTVPRSALKATKKIVNLVPISANSVGPSQTLQFLIPQKNLAKAHSFYLKFRLRFTQAGEVRLFSFAGSLQTCAALFNSMSIQAGGQVIEACQNYDKWHNNVLCWTQDINQVGFESPCTGCQPFSRLLQDPGNTAGATRAVVSTAEVWNTNAAASTLATPVSGLFDDVFSMPIGMGFFNPKESQFLPLFQFNGGVLFTLQTNPISKAFFSGGQQGVAHISLNITDYTLSDFELTYTEITPDISYINTVRDGLAKGKVIKIEAQSYLNYQVACDANIRQNLNLNVQSLAASFWGRVEQSDAIWTPKCFVKQLNIEDSSASTPSIRYEMYYDNQLLYNGPNQLNYDSIVLRELQEALTSSITDHPIAPLFSYIGINTGTVTTQANSTKFYGALARQAYMYGLSNKLFASNSTSMDGTPVGTVQIQFSTPGELNNQGSLWYFYFVYDFMYMIDANGNVSKVM